MCRLQRTVLDAENWAPSVARHWVNDLLGRWELPHLSEVAALLTSEVVTNAIRHTASSPRIRVAVTDGFLEIGVTDGDREHLPHMSDSLDATAEGGRGLVFVDEMADSWGTNLRPEGKEVWFLLGIDGWPYYRDCRCQNDEPDRVPMGSGRQVKTNSGPWDDSPFPPGG